MQVKVGEWASYFLKVPSKYWFPCCFTSSLHLLYELYLLSELMKNKVDKCIVTRKAPQKENPLKAP